MIDRFTGKYRFLSNFAETKLTYQGREYRTAEHAYQAAKTDDDAERAFIASLKTPGEAKLYGKSIAMCPTFKRVETMRKILEEKFKNPTLQELLLKTGDRQLIEGNTWGDVFWGMCNGVGANMLGNLLMDIRLALWTERLKLPCDPVDACKTHGRCWPHSYEDES